MLVNTDEKDKSPKAFLVKHLSEGNAGLSWSRILNITHGQLCAVTRVTIAILQTVNYEV